MEIKTDVLKFSDQINQIVTNVRNRLVVLQARTVDQRNIETINTLSRSRTHEKYKLGCDLKIVDGNMALAAIIENNLRTLQPLWNLMQKNNIVSNHPLNTWLEIAKNYNNFKFVYDGKLNLDSIRRSALFDARQDILSSITDPVLENVIANEIVDKFVANQVNAARRQVSGIRQNMDNKEVVTILNALRTDPILGIQMVQKAVADQESKNAAKAAEDAAQAEVSTKKPKPQVEKSTKTLGQKLLDLIPSPAMRRNALIAITTVGVVSVADITAIQGYIPNQQSNPQINLSPNI